MAITAAITLSSSTATAGQKVAATCTVTNSGSTSVNVISVTPKLPAHSGTAGSTSAALGQPPLLPGMTTAVAGSNGTLALTFDVIAHAPVTSYNVGAEPSSFAYDVGATVYTSDGAITEATTATLTVSYPAT